MQKFKLKGKSLKVKHSISVLDEAIRSAKVGNFVGKGLSTRWVEAEELNIKEIKIVPRE